MNRVLIAIAVMALVTYAPRVFPLIAVNRHVQSIYIKSFLYYVPYAVLGAMTFPYILYSTGNFISAIAGMIAALVLSFLNQGLLKVAIGAITVVYLTEMVLRVM